DRSAGARAPREARRLRRPAGAARGAQGNHQARKEDRGRRRAPPGLVNMTERLRSRSVSVGQEERDIAMTTQYDSTGVQGKRKLRIADQAVDIDAELKRFEEEERKRLGLDGATDHWVEEMAGLTFTKAERSKITMLVGGLTIAHDYFVEAGLSG